MTDMLGYKTIQFHDGGLFDAEVSTIAPFSATHLAPTIATGTGAILCGIDRHAKTMADGTRIPGWSVGGGVSGPGIKVIRCEACAARRDPSLKVSGLNASIFGA